MSTTYQRFSVGDIVTVGRDDFLFYISSIADGGALNLRSLHGKVLLVQYDASNVRKVADKLVVNLCLWEEGEAEVNDVEEAIRAQIGLPVTFVYETR